MKNPQKQPSLFQEISGLADAYRGVAVMMVRGLRDKRHFQELAPHVDSSLLEERERRAPKHLRFAGKH